MSTSYLIDPATDNLLKFVERNLSNYVPTAEHEITVARYAFSQKLMALENTLSLIREALADPVRTNQEKTVLLSAISARADEITRAASILTKTIKTGAEIQVLNGSNFDAVQLLYIVGQIPTLLTDILIKNISEFCASLLDKADRTSTRAARISLELETSSFVNELVTELSQKLKDEIAVVSKRDVKQPIVSEQLKAMENTIMCADQRSHTL